MGRAVSTPSTRSIVAVAAVAFVAFAVDFCCAVILLRSLPAQKATPKTGLQNGGTLRILTGGSFRLPEYQRRDRNQMPSSLTVAPRPTLAEGPGAGPPGRLKTLFRSPSVFLFVILAAQLMVVLDTTIVNVALPHIQEGLGLSGSELSWVINGYLLTFGGLLLLGARSGDLLGRRRTFLAGIAIFTVSSLFGGLAVSGWMLLSARALQGVGAALAAPSSLALLTTIFSDGPQRVRAIGLFTTVSAAGGAIGLVAGGALTQLVSWRWGMCVNVPMGLAVFVLGRTAVRETPRRSGHFDIAGAVTSTLGMVGIVFGLVEAGTRG